MTKLVFTWQCPNCQTLLELHQKQWRCANKHSFDLAKEGYVNLLLANQKNSKDPGDNKEMIAARRNFLAQGYYQDLVEALCAQILGKINSKEQISILDVGCGEGYYLGYIGQNLATQNASVMATGIDISKHAISKAAKQYKSCNNTTYHLAVASSFNLPLPCASQDIVIQVFAPSCANEISRVLKANGYWIRVTPASKHLIELKSYVYESPELHKDNIAIPPAFELIQQNELSFTISLDDQQARLDLLAMTPFYWSVPEEKKEILTQKLTSVTAHFQISTYKSIN